MLWGTQQQFDIIIIVKAVIQRVKEASVTIEHQKISAVGEGVLILLGIKKTDTEKEIDNLVEKIINLRIFPNEKGKFDKSLIDIAGEALIVSQFTLYADCSHGRRPSFIEASHPQKAEELYNKFVQKFMESGIKTKTGKFQAMMEIALINDGPVTIVITSDSETIPLFSSQ